MGAYVDRTSSLNNKHSCQLFRIAASFSSLVLHSSSVSTANLSCLLATTFSSLRFLFNSLSSPNFNLLRVARRCFSWFSIFSFSRLIFSLSFLCSSVSEALFALSFSFLSECFFFVHAKAALAYSRNEITRVSQVGYNCPKLDFKHARVWST